jgi:hypothetical protein
MFHARSMRRLRGRTRRLFCFNNQTPTHLSPTTGPLELPALAGDVGLAAVEGTAEVLDGLAVVPLASEEDGVGAGGGAEGELVEGEALAAGGDDALTGRGGEFEGGDRELGDGRETLVVEDGTDGDDRLGAVGVGVAGLLDEARDGERRTVDLVRAGVSGRYPGAKQDRLHQPCS